MRRWLLILMFALVPLQAGWAAVAAYGGHDSGAQAQHLGHHEHPHADPLGAVDDDASGDDASSHFDVDCGHCHCSCCSLPASPSAWAALPQGSRPLTALEVIVRTLAPNPPERPQWAGLA